jgi:hypothetical protein
MTPAAPPAAAAAAAAAAGPVAGPLLLGETVVGGIPIEHEAPPGLDVLARLSAPWSPSRIADAPLRIVHEIADEPLARARPVEQPRAEESAFRYHVDERDAIAVEMDGIVTLDGVPTPVRQRMRTRRPGEEYVLQYADAAHAPLLQWSWQRIVFMDALASRGRGAAAHGCGFVLPSGGGVLAPGVSGAGKSTLARLLAEDGAARVLSDDRLAVTAEERALRIWGTPWPSAANLADPGDAPLRALVFVHHGGSPRLTELRPTEALRRVLRALALPFWSQTLLERALPLVDRLVGDTPAFVSWSAPPPGAGAALVRELGRRVAGG